MTALAFSRALTKQRRAVWPIPPAERRDHQHDSDAEALA